MASVRTWLKKSYAGTFAAILLACAAPGCSASTGDEMADEESDSADALSAGFDRNDVMSDAEFSDAKALSKAQIQQFLKDTPYGTTSILADYSSNGKTAADAIHDTATQYRINPLLILVRAQIEKSLIGKDPTKSSALDYAFGCGCPDGQECKAEYKGFDKQAACLGKSLRGYMDDLTTGRKMDLGVSFSTVSGWQVGKEKATLDKLADPATGKLTVAVKVTPKTRATAALYTYTPWVGGSGGGQKGAGGNSLHWQVWKKFAKASGYVPPQSPPPSTSPPKAPPS